MYEQFTNNSKECVIDAQNGFGDTFTCIKRQIGVENDNTTPIEGYLVIEHDADSEQHLNICIFKSAEEMIKNTTFHTWMMQGIKNKELAELINKHR